MGRLKITDLVAPGDEIVELWDTEFTAHPMTRSDERKFNALQRQLLELAGRDDIDADEEDDQGVKLIADQIDLILRPLPPARKLASVLIDAKWKADALPLSQLVEFKSQVLDLVRPT
jgi:hypothetical protein